LSEIKKYYYLIKENGAFRNLWLADVVSQFGDWFNLVATITVLSEITQSGLMLSLFLMIRLLPSLLITPVAGVFADVYDKRKIMLIADVTRSLTVICFLLLNVYKELWLLYLLSCTQFFIVAFFFPCRSGLLPAYVKEEHLVIANSLDTATWSALFTFGSALGGLTVATAGTSVNYIVDACSYLVSFFFLWRLGAYPKIALESKEKPVDMKDFDINTDITLSPESSAEKKSISFKDHFREFFEGIRYLKNNLYLLGIACCKGFIGLTWGITDFSNIIFSEGEFQIAGSASATLGILWTFMGIGAFLGPIIAGFFTGDNIRKMHYWLLGSFVLRGLGLLLLAWSPHILVGFFADLIITCSGSILWVFSSTILQLKTDSAFIGRIFSVELFGMTLTEMISQIGAGLLFESLGLGLRVTILIFGGVTVLSGIWAAYFFLKDRPEFEHKALSTTAEVDRAFAAESDEEDNSLLTADIQL
jgi:hypothetical protein